MLAYLEYDISNCWHRLKTPWQYMAPRFFFQKGHGATPFYFSLDKTLDMVFNNAHNSYSKISVKLSLTCSQAMLFISVNKRYISASLSFRCYLIYMIWYCRCGVINNNTKHWWHKRTNTIIMVPDITWKGYKYRQKHQPQGSH